MKWTYFILLLVLFATVSCVEQTAHDHFFDVVEKVSNKKGSDLSYHGVYPGITREEALLEANKADNVIKAQYDPSLKDNIVYEVDEPKMKVDIAFVNFGKAIPEIRSNAEIRSNSAKVTRLSLNNGYFDKKSILDELESELGAADKDDTKGHMHTLYYGYYPKSHRQLIIDCTAEFKKKNPEASVPEKEISYTLPAEVTIESMQFVMDTCPAILDVYKATKIRQLSPWLWITFHEHQPYMNLMMSYSGEPYFSPQNPIGPLFNSKP